MAAEVKVKRTISSKHVPGESRTLPSSIRPLGLVRNTKESDLPEEETDDNYSLDNFESSESDTDHHSIDESKKVNLESETMDTTEWFLKEHHGTGSSSERINYQDFRSHEKLCTSKNKSVKKKFIQLPMLKINLESLTGKSYKDDSKTLDSTRRTLKTLLHDSKSCVQTAEIKNYQFITPTDKKSNQSRHNKCKNTSTLPNIRKQRINDQQPPLHLSSTDEHYYTARRLTPRTSLGKQDAISSVAFSNRILEAESNDENDYIDLSYCDDSISTDRNVNTHRTNVGVQDLIIDLVDTAKSSCRVTPVNFYDMATWPSYDDIQQTRKGGNRGCSKHEYLLKKHRFQEELMEQRIRARRDLALSWVNINNSGYKASPILRYTRYQSVNQDSLSRLPLAINDHCPMCSLYRTDRIPTVCPPNTPKNMNDTAFTAPEPMNEESLKVESLQKETMLPTSFTSQFQDMKKLEPVTSANMALKQGFRGSKTPIAFKIGYNK